MLELASRTHKCSFYFSRLTFPESSHHQSAQSVLGIHINSWQCAKMAFLSFGDFTPAGMIVWFTVHLTVSQTKESARSEAVTTVPVLKCASFLSFFYCCLFVLGGFFLLFSFMVIINLKSEICQPGKGRHRQVPKLGNNLFICSTSKECTVCNINNSKGDRKEISEELKMQGR